jgi:hypothetical protein
MEAFKIKNGISAKRYLGSTTTLSGSTIDLSLGSMFSTTLSSDPAYTFTNPPASGNAQAFSVEVTGGTTNFVNDSFATAIYTGTGDNQTNTVTNGIDLAGDGGMVWTKGRNIGYNNIIFDSERGLQNFLYTNTNAAQENQDARSNMSFNSNGYSFGSTSATSWGPINEGNYNFVSWAFKKQAKFFDVVTWTGDGVSGRTISHSLNSEVGFYVVKRLDASGDWRTYHRVSDSASNPHIAYLNGTTGGVFESDKLTATSTTFTIEGAFNGAFNSPGQTYVAYLFAHDTASDSRIKCGSYTGTASSVSINLGWQPQWLLIKRSDSGEDWSIVDNVRGMGTDPLLTGLKALTPNTSSAEEAPAYSPIVPSSTGFTAHTGYDARYCANGGTYIYMAIRASAATDSAITWPSSVKWPSGVAPTTPAPGTKDLFTFLTTDGGTTYYGKKAAEGLA